MPVSSSKSGIAVNCGDEMPENPVSGPRVLDESSCPSGELRTAPNCVDIWTVPIRSAGSIIEELRESLSSDERERALRFYAEEHRNSFVVARGILRAILASYISARPEDLVFGYGSKGKPYLKEHPDLHFNLGHSGELAVYAVAGDELGVDVERMKPMEDWQKISKRFFSLRESDELAKLDPAQQIAGFFACWTRKEAYIKATGEGLAAGLDKFSVGVNPSQADGTIDEDGQPRRWYYKDLKLGDQYAGAVVTRVARCGVRNLDFGRTEDCLRFVGSRI